MAELSLELLMAVVNDEAHLKRMQALLEVENRVKASQDEATQKLQQANDAREEARRLHAGLDGRKQGLDERESTLQKVHQSVEAEKRAFEAVRRTVESGHAETSARLSEREAAVQAREAAVQARERAAAATMDEAQKLKADYHARHSALHAAMQVTA